VVREMVDETHAVHELVSATTRRIEDEQCLEGELAACVRTLEDEIRHLSDDALYETKRTGKNRTCVS
jgi:hypothetical protein